MPANVRPSSSFRSPPSIGKRQTRTVLARTRRAVTLRDRGGRAGEVLVTAQQARTDDALAAFDAATRAAAAAAPGLRPALDAAASELAALATVRGTVATGAGAAADLDVPALYAP